jgi:hypothetical protein
MMRFDFVHIGRLTMSKLLPFLAVVLIAAAAPGQTSQPTWPLRATILPTSQRVTLASHGDNYLVLLADGKFNVRINQQGYTIRISAAEGQGKTMDWYDHVYTTAAMTASSDEMKELTVTYAPAYPDDAPPAESRRAKADQPPAVDASLTVVLRVYADKPGLHMTYTLTNGGEPYVYYLLPWIGGSAEGYTIPGPEDKPFAGKYADVSTGGMPWIIVKRDDEHAGFLFPDPEHVFIGEHGSAPGERGSIYFNAIPRYPQLKTGESMAIDMVIIPVVTADEMVEAAKAYGVE